MIKGSCYTNLDEWKRERWPTQFVSVPRVGECVRAESGRYLKVCRVTHCMVKDQRYMGEANYAPHPEIEVELHK